MYDKASAEEAANIDGLPDPKGYHILVSLPEVMSKTAGGITLPDELVSLEKTATVLGLVVSMGELCYADKKKFPSGKWCNVGDWVLFKSYSGTRVTVDKKEFRVINDDTVEATVPAPERIGRAG